jgi:low affinity Fe/Cu permease
MRNWFSPADRPGPCAHSTTRTRSKNADEPREGGVPTTASADWHERFARAMTFASSRPAAFLIALGIVLAWLVSGPLFGFSDTWQLVINTGTTIVTFLMVFLIQRAQNRDTMAVQAKLAELVIAVRGAKNVVAVAEDLSEHELEALHNHHSEEAQGRLDRMEREAAAIRAGKRRQRASAK